MPFRYLASSEAFQQPFYVNEVLRSGANELRMGKTNAMDGESSNNLRNK